ncbi:MAG: hypothetical protein PHV57_07130 [Methanomicrobiaceae archaeon]|nr:hypothetical protein [Methanomicrobiaceae archaeon]
MAKTIYEETVARAVLKHSVSPNYNQAKLEWEYRGEVEDYGPLNQQKKEHACQACGHRIRYGYIVRDCSPD